MIGAQNFVSYLDWTFEYLRQSFGEGAVMEFWTKSLFVQRQAWPKLKAKGIRGAAEHWGWQLDSEEAGCTNTLTETYFRIDMFDCPSKGMLLRIDQEAYHDYCNHCIAWIKPIADDAGLVVDHEHNHCAQCWFEFRSSASKVGDAESPPIRGSFDVRLLDDWPQDVHDVWLRGRPVVEDRARKAED
jgi:hypothetical protein